MSKIFAIGVAATVFGFAAVPTAQAQYGGSWYNGGYGGYGYGCSPGPAYAAPPAQPSTFVRQSTYVPPGPATAMGPMAQSPNQSYQSFSAEPSQLPAYSNGRPAWDVLDTPRSSYYYGNGVNSYYSPFYNVAPYGGYGYNDNSSRGGSAGKPIH